MSVKTTPSGEIIPRNAQPQKPALYTELQRLRPAIAQALPAHVKPDRMLRIITSALRTVPKLAECEPMSFFGCVLQLSQLGLEPNTPLQHAWLIPRYSRKTKERTGGRYQDECTQNIGYRGMIDLYYRSPMSGTIRAMVVRKGDVLEYQEGTEPRILHVPAGGSVEREVIGSYAVAKLKNGETIQRFLSLYEILARRDATASRDKDGNIVGPWRDNFAGMAQKSAIRAIAPFLPQASELGFGQALVVDESDVVDPDVSATLIDYGYAEAEEGAPAEKPVEEAKADPKPAATALRSAIL